MRNYFSRFQVNVLLWCVVEFPLLRKQKWLQKSSKTRKKINASHKKTAGIGDGGNDVGMIQSAGNSKKKFNKNSKKFNKNSKNYNI